MAGGGQVSGGNISHVSRLFSVYIVYLSFLKVVCLLSSVLVSRSKYKVRLQVLRQFLSSLTTPIDPLAKDFSLFTLL